MEQKEIKDAEVEQAAESIVLSEEDLEKKKKREALFELALFFVLGVLLGITIKTEAVKRITMGFNDYQISSPQNKYDLENIKKEIEAKEQIQQQEAQKAAEQQMNNSGSNYQETDQQTTDQQESQEGGREESEVQGENPEE